MKLSEYIERMKEEAWDDEAEKEWGKLQEMAEFLKGRESIMTYEEEAEEAKQIVRSLKKLSLEIISIAEALDDFESGNRIKQLIQKILEGEK